MAPSAFFRLGAGILAAAAAVRLAGLGRSELWHDEFCSLLMLADPGGVLAAAASSATTPDGGNPPLYYLLLAGWTRILGLSDLAVRGLSTLAGVAQVAVTGALVRAAGGGREAALAGMGVAAVASLPAFYSTEARAYAWLLLLLTGAVWTFFRALRRGGPLEWALHAAVLAAAWYTHNLALPFTASFWIAAVVLRAGRRGFLGLAAAHVAVVALYSPWIPVLAAQSGSETHEWIRLWWERTSALRAVTWSLELLGIAGPAPEYLDLPRIPSAVRWGSAALTAAALIGAFAPPSARERSAAPRRAVAALAVFVLFPLAFLLVYSWTKAPLYLVGRYDLPAAAAFPALAGLGLARLGARTGRAGAIALVAAGTALALGAHHQRLFPPSLHTPPGDKSDRIETLARHAGPDDLIVCTGFTASEILAQAYRRDLRFQVVTFPRALRSHVGWYNPGNDLARGEEALRAEADDLVRRAMAAPRAFLVAQTGAAGGAHARLIAILQDSLTRQGCQALYPPSEALRWQELGVCALACGEPAR
ncbi:MAG TPA: glycosyltransferase family 39 protein [bacterium]|nr:glycosyltransferase family 39 protein [bacterium]